MRKDEKEKIKVDISSKEEEKVKNTVCTIVTVIIVILLTIIVGGLVSWGIMVFWNSFLTNYFCIATIGFFDAMAIFGIIWLIVYGFKALFAGFQSINNRTKKVYDKIDFDEDDD